MCNWFPVAYNAEYVYKTGKLATSNTTLGSPMGGICTDTSIAISDMVFSHRHCSELTLTFDHFQNAVILHKDVNVHTVWMDTLIGGMRYKTWQEAGRQGRARDTMLLDGKKYAYRQVFARITDSINTERSTNIVIRYTDEKGIIYLSKMKGSEDGNQYILQSTSQ